MAEMFRGCATGIETFETILISIIDMHIFFAYLIFFDMFTTRLHLATYPYMDIMASMWSNIKHKMEFVCGALFVHPDKL